MIEPIDLSKVERNLFRDFLQDGLADMLLGAAFLFIGLLLPRGGVVAFVAIGLLFYTPLLRALKRRFTYPRAGYVELRQADPTPLPWFTLGAAVLGLVTLIAVLIAAGAIAHPALWYRWMPIFFGIWLAGIFLGLGLNVRLARYYVMAGVALAAGPACALLPLSGKLANIGLFFAVAGAVPLAWGAVVFLRFLLENPVAQEGGAGGAR